MDIELMLCTYCGSIHYKGTPQSATYPILLAHINGMYVEPSAV